MEVQKTIITFAKRIIMEQIRTNTEVFKQNFCLPKESKEEVDDTLMSEEEFFAMIDNSKESAKKGNITRVKNKEELYDFLNRL